MRSAIILAMLTMIAILPSCTDQEWVQIVCDDPQGVKGYLLCWSMSGAQRPPPECTLDSDCKGACHDRDTVMVGRCRNQQCTLEYSYSCQEYGRDSICQTESGKPSCTKPEGQCSGDDQCPSKCDGKNVMGGKCQDGRCKYEYSSSCQEYGIDSRCVMQGGSATCTQPADQCASDTDCSDACKDDDVMEGYCNKGRCDLGFVETCDTRLDCVVKEGKASCQ